MANSFDKIIEDFLKINGGEEDETIKAIRMLAEEAGDVDELTALNMVKDLLDKLSGATADDTDDDDEEPVPASSSSSNEEIVVSDEDKLTLAQNVATVKKYLDSKNYNYRSYSTRPDVEIFEMNLTVGEVTFRIKIRVETDPNACRISAFLPIAADPLYVYPLSLAMAKLNYRKRYGAFKYDERDGEMSYEFNFRITHGINLEDFHVYFRSVINTSSDGYKIIRNNSVGKYKKSEADEILEKLKMLAKDLADE